MGRVEWYAENGDGEAGRWKRRACAGVEAGRFGDSLAKMSADALASGSPQNNPVVPTAEQISELYREAF